MALGVAQGLSYLHEQCTQPILHLDIKPENILLDSTFVAKIADFGMSRMMHRDVSKVVTGVRGTPGYLAPEWLSHGTVGKKCDVYSMGMVMLEIVGGRRNVDLAILDRNINGGHQHVESDDPQMSHHDVWYFPTWVAKKCTEGSIMDIINHRLVCGFDQYAEEQA